MPQFESVSESVTVLKRWSAEPPGRLDANELGGLVLRFGERHESWFLRLTWEEQGLSRLAEIALTNAEAVPDDQATAAVLSVRAGASDESRYVLEPLYERRRSVNRLDSDEVEELLASAINRATAYVASSLANAYATGLSEGPSS